MSTVKYHIADELDFDEVVQLVVLGERAVTAGDRVGSREVT
jgi:hypothetical protein